MASDVEIRPKAVGREWARVAALLLLALPAFAADQAAKAVVRATLDVGEGVLVGPFSILHLRNPGIAGGEPHGSAVVLAFVAFVVVVGICHFMIRRNLLSWPVLIGFGLIFGGGMSNLFDRVRLGYVTDFIAMREERVVFNIADVAISLGGIVVLVALVASVRTACVRAEPSAERSGA